MITKHERIISLLEEYDLDGLLIKQVANFAWATDGAASYINTASTYGAGTLLVTRDARHLITNNIEGPRFDKEEGLKAAGWEFHIDDWYLASDKIEKLTKGLKLGADFAHPGAADLSGKLSITRSCLDEDEQAHMRALSSQCAQAMDEAIRSIKPGMTEYQIAGVLAKTTQARGAQPIVNLIATDDRIYHFRHPLPTNKVMEKYAMLVLCGRQKGLVCSITRLIHFGALPDPLKDKSEAVAAIDAAMIAATRPGVTAADIFQKSKDAYAKAGYANEYKLHHQGGPAGYNPREFIATPTTSVAVEIGQTYAWNPSITGCKSEDTILVGENSNEVLTTIQGWPRKAIQVDGQTLERPEILVVDA